MPCPDDKTLKLSIAGRLAPQQIEWIERHLENCPACSERLSKLETEANIPILQDLKAAQLTGSDSMAVGGGSDSIDEGIPGTIGHYKVCGVLGAGGMGTVYLAENSHLDRSVAIKVVKASRQIHQSSIDRFVREMKAAGKLHHSNIVQALDGGVIDGQPYLVMEYLEGCDLSRYVKEHGPLPVKQACNIIRQVAAGLDYAHRLGYVHRDIKPQNLWITPDGTVKILDFGLVSLLESEKVGGSVNPSPYDTSDGTILGSSDYISPEQAGSPQKADSRSDVYSLGCTFFYLLTGRPPFDKATHPTLNAKLEAHATGDFPPLRFYRNDVPTSVEAVLRKMVAKRPEYRFQTASEIVFNEPVSNRSRKSAAVASLIAILLLLIAGIAVAMKYSGRDQHAVNTPIISEPVRYTSTEPESVMPKELPVVRMILEIDADNKGRFHVAKGLSTDPPDDSFQGEVFTHSAFPHALAVRGEHGMGRMVWGFDDPMEAWKNYDKRLAVLQSIAEIKDGALWTYLGGGGLGIWNARLPIRVSCDFPDIHDGELQIHIGGGIGSQYGRFLLIVKCNEDGTYGIEVWPETISVTYGSDVQMPGTLKVMATTKLEQPVEQSFQVSDTLRNTDIVVKRMAGQIASITRVDVIAHFVAATDFALKETDDRLTKDKSLSNDEIIRRLNPNKPRLPLDTSKKSVVEIFDGKPCVEVVVDGLPMVRPRQGKELVDWEKENGKNK